VRESATVVRDRCVRLLLGLRGLQTLKNLLGCFVAMAGWLLIGAVAYAACDPRRDPISDAEFRLRATQDDLLPLIRGVAYDTVGEQVFISACPRREFDCDLMAVSMTGGERSPVRFLRQGGAVGYTWPSVSPDGARLAVVRTDRRRSGRQYPIEQDLVSIDLRTGDETVLASSHGQRFERIVFPSSDTVVAVRTRSSGLQRCAGGPCLAEVLVVKNGRERVLPIQAVTQNVAWLTALPLGSSGPLWIFAPGPVETRMNPLVSRGWLLDVERGSVSGPASTVPEMTTLLEQAEQDYGGLGGWTIAEMLEPRAGTIEREPFCATRAELASITQTVIASPNRGAYVAKRREGRRMMLQVVTIEGRGASSPWAPRTQVEVEYLAPR
jgi:hypothetical protein